MLPCLACNGPGQRSEEKGMTAKRLTERQREVLGFIRDFISEQGYAPSLREVASHLGIRGAKNAGKHLAALEKKGFIRRSPGLSRAIELSGTAAGGAGTEVSRTVSIPIAGRVRAGEPNLAVEDVLGHVALDERFFNCADAFLLQIEGESMVGAGIEDGDFVIVKPQATAANGDIVVALLYDEATVKRFFWKGSKIVLKPENPDLEPIVVAEDGPEVTIIGKVISVIKRMEK